MPWWGWLLVAIGGTGAGVVVTLMIVFWWLGAQIVKADEGGG